MSDFCLYPLIPQPIDIKNGTFSGKLMIDGNILNNIFMFRFQFDDENHVSPVCLQIEVLDKIYYFYCIIRDFCNPVMKSELIKPDFSLENHIKILKAEPLISFKEESSFFQNS